MKRYWQYRVIEFTDPSGEAWRAIHEVHFDNDKPVAYGAQPAHVISFQAEGKPPDLKWVLDRMREALDKPILLETDFPSETSISDDRKTVSQIGVATMIWTTVMHDAGDGSGDGILELSDGLLKHMGWQCGDVLDVTVENGQLVVRSADAKTIIGNKQTT